MVSFQSLNARLIAGEAPKRWFPNARQFGLSLRIGSLDGEEGSSLWVCLRTGRWYDHATCEGGSDLISLYASIHKLSQSAARKELDGADSFRKVEVAKAPKAPKVSSPESLRYITNLWLGSTSAEGTVVEGYFQSRAINMAIPNDIRFVPYLYHKPSQKEFPAMLAAIRHGRSKELIGLHRTWLKEDGSGKADVTPSKMMLGKAVGGAIQLAPAAKKMIIAEGIETALSVMQVTGIVTWSALSTSGLKGLLLPSVVKHITIACDNDPAGIRAANDAADKWAKEGLEVSLAIPPLNRDFNDLLLGKSE